MNTDPEITDSQTTAPSPGEPRATAYHRALLLYLQAEEKDLWDWFSSHQSRAETADAVRLDLLKSAYRLDREAAVEVYQLADSVAESMGLEAPVTLYQAQHPVVLNASIAWLPDEVHVVLHGPVQETLSSSELSALLAHEFAHHELYTIDGGVYLVMEHLLAAMISDKAADAPHDRTWRSHRLYTELYCDRRAVEVTDDVEACVCALVKMETGLKDVSAKAYIEQADEVLADLTKKVKGSDGITHPEMFIRAKAIQLWQDDPESADAELKQFVEGPLELQQMGLLRQQQMKRLTSDLLTSFLAREWLQTELMLGHAKRFFEDFDPSKLAPADAELRKQLELCDVQLRNYFCYVLLDFVTYDADLEEAPLAAAFLFAENVGLVDELRLLAAKELKFGKRALQKVESEAEKIVRNAETEFGV